MAETKRIACAAGVYTQLSSGQGTVSAGSSDLSDGRIAISPTQPSPATQDYVVCDRNNPFEATGLGVTDFIWFMHPNSAVVINVMRG